MFLGGVTFLIGSVVNGAARNVFLPILGIGIGFANQARLRTCNIVLFMQVETEMLRSDCVVVVY
ncbi:hypothetical protein B296_00048929 [Ensete ventricosum]|uniref:Uncharacterized protein n=1 Tax=Ensete ventricosum TaxID=4639 RepID=A0A426YSS4_ENSVE|nr:hypothetical protein B296_00048929 [Ensete ventricosum]